MNRWKVFVLSLIWFSHAHPGSLVFDVNQGCNAPTEPEYCKPENSALKSKPIKTPSGRIVNLHYYEVGDVKLVGVGVGESDISTIKQLASSMTQQEATNGKFLSKEQYCTWYFGHDKTHLAAFNNVGSGYDKSINKKLKLPELEYPTTESIDTYLPLLNNIGAFEGEQSGPAYADEKHPSFLYCLEKYKYLAIGCEAMLHRGPTVFGMLLAFSGCCPLHTFQIIDREFHSNGVGDVVRKFAFAKAYEYGKNTHPLEKKQLQDLFVGTATDGTGKELVRKTQ